MKVLHIVPSLLPESGGPSRSVPELCRALTARGTEVTLFTTHEPGSGLTIEPSQEPYEVVLFSAKDGSPAGARAISKAIKERANEFDLIHIHSLWNLVVTLAASAARSAGLPYVIAPRGMLSEACVRQHRYALKRAYAWTVDRRTVEGAARLHFLNADEQRSSLNGWFRYPEYFLARNGIDLSLDSIQPGSFRTRYPELKGRRIMLFLGRLNAIKGLDLQLQALQRLIGKHPDLIWVLVGPDDGEWQRLNSSIQTMGLQAHVKWIGPVMGEDRFAAIKDADVLVQTSLYECQSMTVNEGLAVGVPLVVTDSINYGEVESAGAGHVVPRDAAQLTNAIDRILQAEDTNERMREAGREFATTELLWTKIAAIVEAAYGDAIAGLKNKDKLPDNWSETQIGVNA